MFFDKTPRSDRSRALVALLVGAALAGVYACAKHGIRASLAAGRLAHGDLYRPGELVKQACQIAVLLPAVVLLAFAAASVASPRSGLRIRRVLSNAERLPGRRFAAILCGTTLFASLLISILVLHGSPQSRDSIGLYFQARTFASGRLSVPAPACGYAFDLDFPRSIAIHGGRWFTEYCPGHPLMLAFGMLLGAPALVGPALGAAALGLIYVLGRNLYDERTGRLAGALGLISPFFLFMSSSFQTHPTALFLLVLFAVCCVKSMRSARPSWGWAGGTALGAAIATRPLTAAALGLPFAVWWLQASGRTTPDRLVIRALPWLGGLATPVLLFLLYNLRQTGSPWTLPYALADPRNVLGFGPWIGSHSTYGTMGHSPAKGLLNMTFHLALLNRDLFGWPGLSLGLAVTGIAAGRLRHAADRLLLASVAALVGVHVFYWGNDTVFGARFYYESLPMLLLLSARGLTALPNAVSRCFRGTRRRRRALSFVMLLVLGMLLTVGGTTRWIRHRIVSLQRGQYGFHPALQGAIDKARLDDALVFVDCTNYYYGNGFLVNAKSGLEPDAPVICVRDLGERLNGQVRAQFAGREIYRFEFDPVALTGRLIPRDGTPPGAVQVTTIQPERDESSREPLR